MPHTLQFELKGEPAKWQRCALVFEHLAEAGSFALDLATRYPRIRRWATVETDALPNSRWVGAVGFVPVMFSKSDVENTPDGSTQDI